MVKYNNMEAFKSCGKQKNFWMGLLLFTWSIHVLEKPKQLPKKTYHRLLLKERSQADLVSGKAALCSRKMTSSFDDDSRETCFYEENEWFLISWWIREKNFQIGTNWTRKLSLMMLRLKSDSNEIAQNNISLENIWYWHTSHDMPKLITAKTDMSSLENKFINSRVLTLCRNQNSAFFFSQTSQTFFSHRSRRKWGVKNYTNTTFWVRLVESRGWYF